MVVSANYAYSMAGSGNALMLAQRAENAGLMENGVSLGLQQRGAW